MRQGDRSFQPFVEGQATRLVRISTAEGAKVSFPSEIAKARRVLKKIAESRIAMWEKTIDPI